MLGTRNKEKLDPERVAKIRKYVFELFPTSELDEDKVWADCRKAIDEYLRRPNKRKSQERLNQDVLEYSMKKDKLSDTPIMETAWTASLDRVAILNVTKFSCFVRNLAGRKLTWTISDVIFALVSDTVTTPPRSF